MDLLQKINNRVRSEFGSAWNKLYDFAYDATLGLIKVYRKKTLELLRIVAASAYLQVLRATRKHLVILLAVIFAVTLSAVAAVVVPVALVMVSPWTAGTKVFLLIALGLAYVSAIALCLHNVLSEEKWMKASGFQELLDSLDSTD